MRHIESRARDAAFALRYEQSKMTITDFAAQEGVSYSKARYHIKRAMRHKDYRSLNSGLRARFSEETRKRIVDLFYKDKLTHGQLSMRFNCSKSTINRFIKEAKRKAEGQCND